MSNSEIPNYLTVANLSTVKFILFDFQTLTIYFAILKYYVRYL